MNTIVECPSEEESDAQWPLAFAHHLAGCVVDRGDVIGVERVAQPECVRRDPGPDRERPGGSELEVLGCHEQDQDPETDHVQAGDHGRHSTGAPPLRACHRSPHPLQPRRAGQ